MYIREKPDFSIGESPMPVTLYYTPQDEFVFKMDCGGFRLEDEGMVCEIVKVLVELRQVIIKMER